MQHVSTPSCCATDTWQNLARDLQERSERPHRSWSPLVARLRNPNFLPAQHRQEKVVPGVHCTSLLRTGCSHDGCERRA